ncbi:V-type proton ATPase subunit F-like [Asparagus officinalis]|uniref:V-type proton ATPase subunit F-like n=1 Tax=Asparagus officinalis TaxID=4686 RepID=UPI00098E6DD5|nr:V-type proton ATPase subunit F-like [Asparagus officinalis]
MNLLGLLEMFDFEDVGRGPVEEEPGLLHGGVNVLLGNNMPCKTVGIGSIKIRTHDGIVRTLINVRHIPKLKKNLISLGNLDSNSFKLLAECAVLRVANMIRFLVDGYNKPIPAILEIPSKNHPYNSAHNSALFRVKYLFSAESVARC